MNKKLTIAFAALLGIFLLIKLFGPGERERSFKDELIEVDTAAVTSVSLFPKAENHEEIKFAEENGTWMVSKGDLKVNLPEGMIGQFVGEFKGLKPKRVAAVSKDGWEKYEVTEELGTRLKVMEGSKTVADLIVGKFTFTQQPQTITSYVRLADEEKVYAVDGALSMLVNRDFNSFRDRSFLKINKADVTKVVYREGPQNLELSKENNWAGMDSTKVDTYLSPLANLAGQNFKDDFQATTEPTTSIRFEGNNMQAVTVNCYALEGKFVCNSSQFPSNYFESDSTGIYKQLTAFTN